jgi:hypothetical protein
LEDGLTFNSEEAVLELNGSTTVTTIC